MKKVIGVLGVIAIAMTMFFSTNVSSSTTSDVSLTNLLTMNEADAECPSGSSGICLYVTSGGMACAYYPNGSCS